MACPISKSFEIQAEISLNSMGVKTAMTRS
jgi:hypothetical protein